MQFVAPAQIFLVLWLLAATAPTATALMNGSLVALTDVRSKDLQLLPATDDDSDEAAEGDVFAFIDATRATDAAAFIFLALSESKRSLPLVPVQGCITSYAPEKPPIAVSHSLLHTSLQRHRPKGA
jgi:hypothetical protein